jgi:hypothetical protein
MGKQENDDILQGVIVEYFGLRWMKAGERKWNKGLHKLHSSPNIIRVI